MSAPAHIDPAILAEVLAAARPRLLATVETLQNAILRTPSGLSDKPARTE